jgi:hypothetical protein
MKEQTVQCNHIRLRNHSIEHQEASRIARAIRDPLLRPPTAPSLQAPTTSLDAPGRHLLATPMSPAPGSRLSSRALAVLFWIRTGLQEWEDRHGLGMDRRWPTVAVSVLDGLVSTDGGFLMTW